MPKPNKKVRGTKLTRKQKAFADKLISDPKISATRAALETYGKPGKDIASHTAEVIASENLRKPEILSYLNANEYMAQSRIVEIAQSKDEQVALRASQDILDRVHGKATQKIESSNVSVEISIDLS